MSNPQSNSADEIPEKTSGWKLLSGVALLVSLVWASYWFVPSLFNADLQSQGLRGDAFGGLNALFAGLAFAGVIVAIWLQRDELALQREELKLTREEIGRQGTALEEQVDAAARQRFDSTFFQMLGLHHEIVRNLEYGKHSGRATFRPQVLQRLAQQANDLPLGTVAIDDQSRLLEQLQEIAAVYESEYPRWEQSLGHYFRNLYRIIKYVDEADVPDPETYSGLLRAQLSSDELAVLFYNMYSHGYEKFLPLAERYELFQNMPSTALLSPKHATVLQRHRARNAEKWLRLSDDQV